MLSKVKSCGLLGIDGYIVEVETDIANGMPGFEKVGYIVTKIIDKIATAIDKTLLAFV